MSATYRVEITPLAELDVAEIWDYIAQDTSPKKFYTLLILINFHNLL